jgi:hypothetical protein
MRTPCHAFYRALLRVRNPEIIFAVWASSAPVEAQVDMASYYKAAERSLTRNCSADWVTVTRYVDHVLMGSNDTLKDEVKFALMKAELSGPHQEKPDLLKAICMF